MSLCKSCAHNQRDWEISVPFNIKEKAEMTTSMMCEFDIKGYPNKTACEKHINKNHPKEIE